MRKLTVALVFVGLLALPITGLAEGNGNPPKPGTNSNPGLWNAFLKLLRNLENNMPYAWPAAIVDWILYVGTPPWFVGK